MATDYTKGVKIPLDLLALSYRRECKVSEMYFMLFENRIEYKVIGSFEELKDETQLWEEVRQNYRYTRPRANVSDISMIYCNREKHYNVAIDFVGIACATDVYFENGKTANEVYLQLKQWAYGD